MGVNWPLLFLLSVFLIYFKIFFGDVFSIYRCHPDYLIILCGYIAISAKSREAIFAAWLAGLLQDLSSIEHLGLFSLFYLLSILTLLKIKEEIFLERSALMAITFFLSLQCNLLHASYLFLVYESNTFLLAFLCALYTGFATLIVAPILDSIALVSHA